MQRQRVEFAFLNAGHFLDHLVVLVFATAAALRLVDEWEMSYAALIPYATPALVAFGLGAIPAGWLADKWSREGMLVVFFIGIGVCSILCSLAESPLQIAVGLTGIGAFAAIYHPVGIAMVVQGRARTGVPLAINGIFGNLGVASAALLTGFLIDTAGWRAAFVLPGVIAIGVGAAYAVFIRAESSASRSARASAASAHRLPPVDRATVVRVFTIIIFTTAVGGLIFQSTTFALPKIFDERLAGLAESATSIGGYAFAVFTIAAFAQLAVGYLVDRYAVRTVFALVALLQAILFTAMVGLSGLSALLVSAAFMLAVFGQIPINDVLVGRIARSEWRSRAYAARYIVTFSVSATSLPLIGWLHADWGFAALFMVMAAAAACILVAVGLLPRDGALLGRRRAG